jgi:hypothetical protein
MTKFIARILVAVSLAAIGYFLLSLVSAISQVAEVAGRFWPGSAPWVFGALFLAFLALLIAPVIFYFRLPRPPVPPGDDDPAAGEAFLEALRGHLAGNPLLAGMPLASNGDVPPALAKLAEEADSIIKRTASAVFVSTAVMQNGRLDGLFVLVGQLRLVWRVAAIYHGRPSPRQMLHLYGNVAANVVIADNLQEIDFAEIATPIVAAIFPSIKGSLPGLQGISTLLVNSLANGAANAFLTLRVGLVAKAYCGAVSAPGGNSVRKSSTAEALSLVGDIVREQGGRVAEETWQLVRDTVVDVTEATVQGVKGVLNKTADATIETARSVGDAVADATEATVQGVKDALSKTADATIETVRSVGDTLGGGMRSIRDMIVRSEK